MFKHHKTLLVLLLIAGGLIVLKMTDRGESVTLANVQKSAAALKSRAETHYMSSVFIFIAVYIVLTLWLPAAAVLTLLDIRGAEVSWPFEQEFFRLFLQSKTNQFLI